MKSKRYVSVLIICLLLLMLCGCNKTEDVKINQSETSVQSSTMEVSDNGTIKEEKDSKGKEYTYFEEEKYSCFNEFLKGNINVKNPFVENDYINTSCWSEDYGWEEYGQAYGLVDMDGDMEKELIYIVGENLLTYSNSISAINAELIIILHCDNEQLVCWDIYETHSLHMGGYVTIEGKVLWQTTVEEIVDYVYQYDSQGKPSTLITFIRSMPIDEEGYYYYMYGDTEEKVNVENEDILNNLQAAYSAEEIQYQEINSEDTISRDNADESVGYVEGIWQLSKGNAKGILTGQESLELLYQYLYTDSKYAPYGYLFTKNEEGIPVLNTDIIDYKNRLGYYVVLFVPDENGNECYDSFENYKSYTFEDGLPQGIILEYTGISDDGKSYEFWLYEYILEIAPEGHASTLNFYWVSTEDGSIYCERTDE